MGSIFGKARNVVFANIHTLLDRAIDANSIGSLKQYARDLEEAKEQVADEAAVAVSRNATMQHDIETLETQYKTTEENIDLILTDGDPSNDHLAEPLAARLIGYTQEITSKEEELSMGLTMAQDLTTASTQLGTRLNEMLSNIRRLSSMEAISSAKGKAADALDHAASSASVDGPKVDDVERRIRDRSAVNEARFRRGLGSMADSVDLGVVTAQAKELIANRRAKLAENLQQ